MTADMCGVPHPEMPGVTCQRYGQCPMDWHAAVVGEPPHAHWLEWGKDYHPPVPGQPHITGYTGWQPHHTLPE